MRVRCFVWWGICSSTSPWRRTPLPLPSCCCCCSALTVRPRLLRRRLGVGRGEGRAKAGADVRIGPSFDGPGVDPDPVTHGNLHAIGFLALAIPQGKVHLAVDHCKMSRLGGSRWLLVRLSAQLECVILLICVFVVWSAGSCVLFWVQ